GRAARDLDRLEVMCQHPGHNHPGPAPASDTLSFPGAGHFQRDATRPVTTPRSSDAPDVIR
ncbi:MAG: hypothetical protein WBF75_25730, partial [Pseudonocardiaceae bacterium]